MREWWVLGWRRALSGALLGAVAFGAAGASAAPGAYPGAPAARGSAALTSSSTTALDVVLHVRAPHSDPVVVTAPGAVEGFAAPAAVVASALPAGLTGPPGTSGPLGVPDRVLAAYHLAETVLARRAPSCHAPWWILAGIGRVESHHAGSGRVDAAGRTRGEILGHRLDGTLAGTRVIVDSDGGALDLDPQFDRAVGPMQFLPGTWRTTGADADGDRRADPHDVDDAALSAGLYLCRGGTDLADEAQVQRALRRYNDSQEYVDTVLAWGTSYRDRAVPVPGAAGSIAPPPAVPAPPAPLPPAPSVPATPQPGTTPAPPAGTPSPSPSPAPSPSPEPVPSPSPTTEPPPEPAPDPSPGPSPAPVEPSLP